MKELFEYNGTEEQHLQDCIKWTKDNNKVIPLQVFRSMYKERRNRYLDAIDKLGFCKGLGANLKNKPGIRQFNFGQS